MKIYDLYEKATTGLFCLIGIALVTLQLLPNQSEKFKTQISDTGIVQIMNASFASFKGTTNKSIPHKQSTHGQVMLASTLQGHSNLAIVINQDTIPSEKKRSRSVIHSVNDDQEVEVTIIDGGVTKLKINGKKIAPADFDKYADLVESVQSESGPGLSKPTKERRSYKSSRSDEDFQKILIKSLLDDKLINDENKFSFSITKNELVVNERTASKDILKKYLQIMRDQKGEHISNGTTYEIVKY